MTRIVISDVEDDVLQRLRERAATHGRSAEDEAREILHAALPDDARGDWDAVDTIRERLHAAGGPFGDAAELVREDRER